MPANRATSRIVLKLRTRFASLSLSHSLAATSSSIPATRGQNLISSVLLPLLSVPHKPLFPLLHITQVILLLFCESSGQCILRVRSGQRRTGVREQGLHKSVA